MRGRRPLPTILLLVLPALLVAGPAQAAPLGAYRMPLEDRILAVRAHDLDGDGRRDLVVLVEAADGSARLELLRTPAVPHKGTFFDPAARVRVPCPPEAGGIAVGDFGVRDGRRAVLRFLAPTGTRDLDPDGRAVPAAGPQGAALLVGRSAGEPIAFWDGAADLGSGRTVCWLPLTDGTIVVDGAPLSLVTDDRGRSGFDHHLARHAWIPKLVPADLDGDGTRELVALDRDRLLAWRAPTPGTGVTPPHFELPLPFARLDPDQPPEVMRTPRIQIADVDGDGRADLLVTLLTGRRDKVGALRTILFHYPGPFRDPTTGALRKPASRIDTPSAVLHPTFVDVDGDGDLDYVGDSIRDANMMNLIARVMGKDPPITIEAFRFDAEAGGFESAPALRVERAYPSSEALGNTFRQTGWLADLDGDGLADLLDLGTLKQVEVLRGARRTGRGPGTPLVYETTLAGPFPVPEGVQPDALLTDLDGNGVTDAVLWGERALYLLVKAP